MAVITTYDELKAAFPDLSPTSSVGVYIADVQALVIQTNALLVQGEQALAEAVSLGLPSSYLDAYEAAVAQYQDQIGLLQGQLAGLAGYDVNLEIGTLISTPPPAPAPAPGPPPPPAPAPAPLPEFAPSAPLPYSGDGVRIFGDTPMLLRETDLTLPAAAAYTYTGTGLTYESPDIANDSSRVGTLNYTDPSAAATVIYDGAVDAFKGLVGESVKDLPYGDFAVKASDARDVGAAMNDTVFKVMNLLHDAGEVANNQMTLGEWEDLHDTMLQEEKAKYTALAAGQLTAAVPGIGWAFAPVVSKLFEVSIAEQVTHSYVLRASLDPVISGGPLADIVIGGSAKTTIRLGDGNSLAAAGDAGDTIIVGQGNDSVIGGAGVDLVQFSGSQSQYSIARSADGSAVVTGLQGTDHLDRIERLQFADHYVALDVTGDAGQAYRLYQAAFSRLPDLGGLGYQMTALDSGLSLSQVAGNFIASPEFQRTYGNVDNTQFITLLYQNVLHRAPDAGGLQFHLNEIATGQSRADVLVHFSESPENQANVIGAIQNGMIYTL